MLYKFLAAFRADYIIENAGAVALIGYATLGGQVAAVDRTGQLHHESLHEGTS